MRNHVLEHYLSAAPKANSWDEIDEGLIEKVIEMHEREVFEPFKK